MGRKKKDNGTPVQYGRPKFEAVMRLEQIGRDSLRYQVFGKDGEKLPFIDFLNIPRAYFPIDDDFNMSFIGMNLDGADVQVKDPSLLADLKAKQENFRDFLELNILIS